MDYETFSHNSIIYILYISYCGIIYVPVATHGHSPSYMDYDSSILFVYWDYLVVNIHPVSTVIGKKPKII
jgi:hypothetical protein